MRSISKLDNHVRRRNGPPEGEPWMWFTLAMMESPAFPMLSKAAILVLLRICIEHMAHAGTENGRLAVTQRQFADYGVRKQSVPKAIAELEALGLVNQTDRGRKSYGDFPGRPARFRLTWLPVITHEDLKTATNDWKRHSIPASAQAAVAAMKQSQQSKRAARKAVSHSRRPVDHLATPADGDPDRVGISKI